MRLRQQEDFKSRLNIYFAMMKYSTERNQARENILKIVQFERIFHKNNEQEMLCSLHNILYPELFQLLMDVMEPGIIEKDLPSLANLMVWAEGNKYVNMLVDILSLIFSIWTCSRTPSSPSLSSP